MRQRFKPDLPILIIVFLALLAVPRVVLHDLHLVAFNSVVYKALAVGPLAVWLGLAIARPTRRPWQDFLALGLIYGGFLGLTHQILWDASWGGNVPKLGGNLEGQLSAETEAMLLRTAAMISSLITGLVTGALLGVVAAVAAKARRRDGTKRGHES